ncbi:hypothetical protein OSSY52_03720 [Tepiditoga spiralis]|uniref:Glycosyltransferase 2-like domain-containing protein n=1 Tax=Tepiditoga spiralis TaxID=2108365 RepID=A0A7G1G1U4_9BACT|nr:glycosyltransferase [Tepiditoga spiralis]BBE30231.1 hypothetical protein OSSY52_03720 [Tepiditoga spiralis]
MYKNKKDNRIKLIKLEKNSDATVSRNIAIKEANGKYIAFLDSNDLWKKTIMNLLLLNIN